MSATLTNTLATDPRTAPRATDTKPATPSFLRPHIAYANGRAIGYSTYYVSADGRLLQFVPPTQNGYMNLTFACGVAKHCIDELKARRAYILRNTFGPQGNISTGHVVRWDAAIQTDADVTARPHFSEFLSNP